MSFGNYFRELRKAKNITQKTIATAIGKSTMLISGIETGKNNPFSEADLEIIVNAMDLSDDEALELVRKAAMARGKLPQKMSEYIFNNSHAFKLLDVISEKNFGEKSLEEITAFVAEME